MEAPTISGVNTREQSLAAGRSMPDELLAMDGIRKAWKEHVVLDGVDLVLDRRTITSITGTNGIGKTTLLRIAAGLIMADAGIIDLEGLHPRRNRRSFQRRIGFLAAGDRGLYARLTVQKHLELWGRLSLMSRDQMNAAIERIVDGMSLESLAERRVDRLSMGQRQRLRIAMTFMHQPDVVLLDEPLNSLDQQGADRLGLQLEELRQRGGAALWCSPGTDAPPLDFDVRLELIDGKLRRQVSA
jgi:ABC-2 type transport system ATP-binding protein